MNEVAAVSKGSRPRTIQVTAHLPAVLASPKLPMRCGEWSIRLVTFEQWQELDGTYADCSIEFGDAKPVFAQTAFVSDADIHTAIIGDVSRRVDLLHWALLLTLPIPLPSPHQSCWYARYDDGSTAVHVGPMGRAWIIYGNYQPRYDAFKLIEKDQLNRAWDLIQTTAPHHGEDGVTEGMTALSLTASPGFSVGDSFSSRVNEFVHCVIALERLLLPAKENAPAGMKLTPTFGHHLALCLQPESADCTQAADELGQLYNLRSRLIHGELGHNLNEEENQYLALGRYYLAEVLRRVMRIRIKLSRPVHLPNLLLAATRHSVAREHLVALLTD